jgi:predicted Fe-Mo cluster-binding NifX family protein
MGMKNASIQNVMEKVAIPIWEDRISPVLDTASCLLVVELDGKTEHSRETFNLTGSHIFQRVRYISELHIDTMLCGALSRFLLRLLTESGIKVYPWVTGRVKDVLEAYIGGNLGDGKFALPGCHRGRRRHGRRHHHGNGFKMNKNNSHREDL